MPALILAPCAKLLTAPGVDRLRELAAAPAPRSTSRTSPAARRTSAGRGFRGSTSSSGSGTRLRYGLVDPIEDDEVVLRVRRDLGELTAGTQLTFRVAGEPSARAYLPGRAGRRGGRRSRRRRPSGSAPPRARRRRDGLLHLSARAPGRADTAGEPGGARGASTRRSPPRPASRDPSGSTTRASSSAAFGGRMGSSAVFVNCSDDPSHRHADHGQPSFRELLPRSVHARRVRCRDRVPRERATGAE